MKYVFDNGIENKLKSTQMFNLLKLKSMKTKENITSQMDEIIFENRNKSYGAYMLRRMYNKHLNRALLLAIAILFAGLVYPVVSGYNAKYRLKHPGIDDGSRELVLPPPSDVTPPPVLPDPPPAISETRIRLLAPRVTTEAVDDDRGIPIMDDLNLIPPDASTNVSFEPVADKKPDILVVPEDRIETVIFAEEMPLFPGGETEFQKFLANNVQYPQQAKELDIQGTVYVYFVIDSKGNVTDVKVVRGIGGGCDEEAVRVVKMSPQWHPGKQNGKNVRVSFNIGVGFKLKS